jgi:hypothetical protein
MCANPLARGEELVVVGDVADWLGRRIRLRVGISLICTGTELLAGTRSSVHLL